ncbi:MAG: GlxA family transcriptional regulator [Pseudomonas sp.]
MTRTVAIVVFSGAQSLDITGPMDVFAEANRFLLPDQHYLLDVVGVELGVLQCSNGLLIQANRHFSETHQGYDLLLCVGGPSLAQQNLGNDFYEWLAAHTQLCNRFGSICNGAFMLARARLLENRIVTTHWNDADALSALCPNTQVEPDKLYIQDSNLYTSAGVTAGIDLSLYLVSKDHGPEVALNVAKRLVVFTQRSGGQSQFSPFLTLHAEAASPVGQAQQYVLANLRAPLTIDELAKAANMSVRHFTRTFVRETKVTPSEFVERARVDAARAVLETSQLPLKTVAYECGFHSAHHMRIVFVRRLGVSPKQFRLNFGAPDYVSKN